MKRDDFSSENFVSRSQADNVAKRMKNYRAPLAVCLKEAIFQYIEIALVAVEEYTRILRSIEFIIWSFHKGLYLFYPASP